MNQAPIRIIQADFIKGISEFTDENELTDLAQVVCVGRSNAGKSTLINRLVGQKKLARTSKQPGRTQQINIFECIVASESQKKKFSLIDLPGYGYAVASKAKKGELSKLLVSYLSTSTAIRICLLIQDIRRDVEHEELAIRKLLFERDVLVQPVLTKGDKLRSGERKKRTKAIAQQYGLEESDIFTTGDGESIEPILTMIQHVTV